MSVRSGQSITKKFTTSVFSTGAAANADSLPTGTLYVNGVADAATVTITNVATGSYKAQVTLPTLAVGDVVDLEISATVSSVSAKGVIWSDTKDLVIDSAGLVDSTTVKAGPSGAATAQTARDLGASVLLSVGTGTGQVNLSSGKVPATLAASDVTGNVAADLQTIKTQTVTCAAGVTVGVYVGGTAAAATSTELATLQTTANTINTATGTYLDATVSSRGTSTLTQTQVTGGAYALNSSSFAFNAAMDFTTTQKAATLARVTLVDTTTTNTDMRGTDNAALAATALSTATWSGTLATNLGTLAGHDPGSALASASALSTLQTTANSIDSTVTTNADTSGTTTLLGRLTSARGGYLDNLNVGGAVSSHADIVNFTQSMPNAMVVNSLVYPVQGTDTAYPITLYIWNENGQLQDADSHAITNAITNAVGTDRSSNFSGWTHTAAGTYTATYTVTTSATLEPLVMKFSGTTTTNSITSNFVAVTQPQVNADGSVSFSSTDRTNLTAIYNKLPANNIADETLVLAAVGSPMQAYTQPTGFLTATFPATVASTTNITSASGINLAASQHVIVDSGTVTNLTNAPAAGDFTATMKTSLNAATPAVTVSDKTGFSLTSAYDPAKTAATQTSVDDLPTNAELATALGTADDATLAAIAAEAVKTTAIKAKTDNLPSDPADQSLLMAAIDAVPTAAEIDTLLSANHGAGNWGSIAGGTGARTVALTVNDGSAAIESAHVRLTKGAESYVLDTDASGHVTFSLDDGTWSVAITIPGYTFTPTTLVIAANVTHTYSMTQITITPSDPGQVTGFIYCYDEVGAVEEGVEIHLHQQRPISGTGIAYDDAVRTGISDADGLVEFVGMFKGGRYSYYRGTSDDRHVEITVPTTATDPYELKSIAGTD